MRNARRLRRAMSLPEVLLWQALRGRPGGVRFRRQHPIGRYVVDFYCAGAKLAIEVDGEAHDRRDRPVRDRARDRWLSERGLHVVRVSAADVLRDVAAVADSLARHAMPLHRPSGGPPPHAMHGEDQPAGAA